MRPQNGIDRTKEIKEFIEEHHKGKGSPIKIKCLLPKLQSYIPDIENRDMRKAYETLVLCWGKDGIYAPATEEEKEEQIERFKKLIRGYAREIKRMKYYKIPSEKGQMNLYGEG